MDVWRVCAVSLSSTHIPVYVSSCPVVCFYHLSPVRKKSTFLWWGQRDGYLDTSVKMPEHCRGCLDWASDEMFFFCRAHLCWFTRSCRLHTRGPLILILGNMLNTFFPHFWVRVVWLAPLKPSPPPFLFMRWNRFIFLKLNFSSFSPLFTRKYHAFVIIPYFELVFY